MGNSRSTGEKRDIQARAFDFAVQIVRLHQKLARQGSAGRVMSSQLLRSGTSIGANLEEASVGQSRADFIAKCVIALKEARETHYWLRLIAACQIAGPQEFAPIIAEANELVAILTTIVKNSRTPVGQASAKD
jgi:four helix bundle protein